MLVDHLLSMCKALNSTSTTKHKYINKWFHWVWTQLCLVHGSSDMHAFLTRQGNMHNETFAWLKYYGCRREYIFCQNYLARHYLYILLIWTLQYREVSSGELALQTRLTEAKASRQQRAVCNWGKVTKPSARPSREDTVKNKEIQTTP